MIAPGPTAAAPRRGRSVPSRGRRSVTVGRWDQPFCIDNTTAIASMAPAAPSEWPVTPFVEVTGAGIAEHLGHRRGLGGVVERGRRAVRVDVAHIGEVDARRRRAPAHAADGAGATGSRRGDVMRIRGGRRTEHLGEDRGASCDGHVPLLEDENARRFGDDEAVAVAVERARHATGRQRSHVGEPGDRGRGEAASLPPVITTSQRPSWISRAALPIEWVPAAHAVTVFSHGPWKPYRIEMRRPRRWPSSWGRGTVTPAGAPSRGR